MQVEGSPVTVHSNDASQIVVSLVADGQTSDSRALDLLNRKYLYVNSLGSSPVHVLIMLNSGFSSRKKYSGHGYRFYLLSFPFFFSPNTILGHIFSTILAIELGRG
jgi:hypothetical protein